MTDRKLSEEENQPPFEEEQGQQQSETIRRLTEALTAREQ